MTTRMWGHTARLALWAAGAATMASATTGCVQDAACGVCDDDNLVLQILAGPNYANEQVLVVSPECKGDRCPEPFDRATFFIESVGPCEETDAAIASVRGPEEYCKIAPIVVSSGLQFIFNNLLEPSYVELIRTRPDNQNLFETYEWRTRILAVEGPISRYSGDWRDGGSSGGDTISRLVNLSCVDNLRRDGIPYGHADYADPTTNPCNRIGPDGRPRKLQRFDGLAYGANPPSDPAPARIDATRGAWDDRAIGEAADIDCDTPVEGPDTCCSQCDWSLGVAVKKHGEGAPIACDPLGDRLIDCAGFVAATDRSDEPECEEGACERDPVVREDRLRELHPSQRDGVLAEREGPACVSDSECRDLAGIGLAGAECVGTNAEGAACSLDAGDPACAQGICRAPWFVECRAEPATTGPTGYCVDARHDAIAAAACFEGAAVPGCEGELCRLSTCDTDADGTLTAGECCGGESCDPFVTTGVTPRARYDRKETLPGLIRALDCGDWLDTPGTPENGLPCDPATQECSRTQRDGKPPTELRICDKGADDPRCRICTLDAGDDNTFTTECRDCAKGGGSCRSCDEDTETICDAQADLAAMCSPNEGIADWAISFVTRLGGVIYDPALKGIEWRPADLGGKPRALIEACAEERGLIASRNVADGWRAHDAQGVGVEHEADWDLGMCSGQRYTVVFETDRDEEYLIDRAGNTLAGKNEYVFETPQFHVVPDSGFPSDSLRIGACDTFSLTFSNKYDLSPENLDKLTLIDVGLRDLEGDVDAARVAGGTGCAHDRDEARAIGRDAVPCLTIDVDDQPNGVIHARIDPVQFGSVLQPGRIYELIAPGYDGPPPPVDDGADAVATWEASWGAAHAAAFWDVCGMPLVQSYYDDENAYVAAEYSYTFTIDPPRCDEDEDGDAVHLSCDNAPELYNPAQGDADADGVGDIADGCPASPEITAQTGDSDRDGIGNGCDSCGRAPSRYNELAGANALAVALYVRNIPDQADADADGIGDACDNCPTVANCGSYDSSRPWRLGDPIDTTAGDCQSDDDDDMIGDVCVGMSIEGAAGPIGLGDRDDFDQDGLANDADACPRQPELDRIVCTQDAECPPGRACDRSDAGLEAGVCNHLDGDRDGVGDVCDTCPATPNATQILDGGMQDDDADGDFVGRDCEPGLECENEAGPRPLGFYEVAVAGACCTTALVADGADLVDRTTGRRLEDPEGRPVRLACNDTACSPLPAELAQQPGIVMPPFGCEDALAAAGSSLDDNVPLDGRATQGDLDALWQLQCRLPPLDQDFDGLGDGCDLCPFAFDPSNAPYVDATGRSWPNDGAACNGALASENACGVPGDDEPEDDTGDASSGA